ncbi:MAG: DNA-binding protein [Candidatus Omnitrophota bacterium]|nr:MAG: DNA-binding protein [Candidatus Omnitrophota bacterium]
MTGSTCTAEEIVRYLRVDPYTVKRLARAGKIPGFKVGGQWRANVNN